MTIFQSGVHFLSDEQFMRPIDKIPAPWVWNLNKNSKAAS